MKILVVDDERMTADCFQRLLAAMGHEVAVATDGHEALEMLRTDPRPLVISDWMMPGLDGSALCRQIRKTAGLNSYTYVILTTARCSHADRLEGLRAGADDFLVKPVDPEELAIRLEIAERIIAVKERLENQNSLLEKLARIDELTGLRNRRSFFESLEACFSQSARQRSPFSLVLIDVDNFKAYNDSFGHPAGDLVLRGVAGVLTSVTRAHDTVARHGGEEFAVLLPGTGAKSAYDLAERMREALEKRAWMNRHVTASFGIATMTSRLGDIAEIVEKADRALYASKHRGRNCTTHWNNLTLEARKPVVGGNETEVCGAVDSRSSPDPAEDQEQTFVEGFVHDQVVEGWSRALILRDCETLAHSNRVTSMMMDLAQALGIAESELPSIRRGSLLHDIGKLGIPDAILHKPGPLSDEEWEVMRRHPVYAKEMLLPTLRLQPDLDIPYCHHEKWDGSGYPRGLSGKEIPLSARAFAVVDVLDALSHDRPYRKAWPLDRVMGHITSLAGSHFDPEVIEALSAIAIRPIFH